MDFQINGDTYFLNLADSGRGWEVSVSTPSGARQIPVYEDAPEFLTLTVLLDEKTKRRVPN